MTLMGHPRRSNRPVGRRATVLVAAVLTAVVAGTVAAPAAAEEAEAASTAYDGVIDLTFPVDPTQVRYSDTYDAGRSHGPHQATDLLGDYMVPIHAAMGGTVSRMPMEDDRYGYRLRIDGDDGRVYSYVHLNNDTPGTTDNAGGPDTAYADGVELGGRVERGQHIAYMGDSGNATGIPHLHFSIADPEVTDPYGEHIRNPYPSLVAAEDEGDVPGQVESSPEEPQAQPAATPSTEDLCPADAEQRFSDVGDDNVHADSVDCLAALDIALGRDDGRFVPSQNVNRLQMASFTARLLSFGGVELPADPDDAFDDDDGSVHELAVNQLVELGVIRMDTGEVGRTFYARVWMKRDRMAAWMARTYGLISGSELPAASADYFSDDSAKHHDDINRLAEAGIVQGTTSGTYEPRDGVRRDQMTSYLARTLALATS